MGAMAGQLGRESEKSRECSRHAYRSNGFRGWVTLRRLHVDLPKFRDDLFELVPFPVQFDS